MFLKSFDALTFTNFTFNYVSADIQNVTVFIETHKNHKLMQLIAYIS